MQLPWRWWSSQSFLTDMLWRRERNWDKKQLRLTIKQLRMDYHMSGLDKMICKVVMKITLNKFSYHWPNSIMYYTIDAAFTSDERAVIAAGFQHMEDNTCIRFVERTDQVDYVDIIPGGGGCYAQLPYRTGGGRLEIGLQQNGCIYVKIVVHELLHSLGFMHEQNRPDRNTYVTINWANIQVITFQMRT